MSEDKIPEDVREFLLECIDSVAQLEALILLRESPREWDIQSLARRLYVEEAEAAKILSSLVACELAVSDGTSFRYYARDDDHKHLVDEVANTYARYLVHVTRLIHEKGIRNFANAFKFRKDR